MEKEFCQKHEAIETRIRILEEETNMIKDKLYGNGEDGLLYRVKKLEEDILRISKKIDYVFLLLIMIIIFNFFKVFDLQTFLKIIKAIFT